MDNRWNVEALKSQELQQRYGKKIKDRVITNEEETDVDIESHEKSIKKYNLPLQLKENTIEGRASGITKNVEEQQIEKPGTGVIKEELQPLKMIMEGVSKRHPKYTARKDNF